MAGDLSDFFRKHLESSLLFKTKLDSTIRKYEQQCTNGEDLESIIDLNTLTVIKDENRKLESAQELKFGKSRTKTTANRSFIPEPELDSNQNVTAESKYLQESEFETIKDISYCVASCIKEGELEPSDADTLSSYSTCTDDSDYSDCQDASQLSEQGQGRPAQADASSQNDDDEEEYFMEHDCLEHHTIQSGDDSLNEIRPYQKEQNRVLEDDKPKSPVIPIMNETFTLRQTLPLRKQPKQVTEKPVQRVQTKFTPFDKHEKSNDEGLGNSSNRDSSKTSFFNKSNSQFVDSGFSTLHEGSTRLEPENPENVGVLSVRNLKAFDESFTEKGSLLFNATAEIKSPEQHEKSNKNVKISNWLTHLDHRETSNRLQNKEAEVKFGDYDFHLTPFSPPKSRKPFMVPEKFVLRSLEEELNRSVERLSSRQARQISKVQTNFDRPVVKKAFRRCNTQNIAEAFQQLKTCNAGDVFITHGDRANRSPRLEDAGCPDSKTFQNKSKRYLDEIDGCEPDSESVTPRSGDRLGYRLPNKYRKIQQKERRKSNNSFERESNRSEHNLVVEEDILTSPKLQWRVQKRSEPHDQSYKSSMTRKEVDSYKQSHHRLIYEGDNGLSKDGPKYQQHRDGQSFSNCQRYEDDRFPKEGPKYKHQQHRDIQSFSKEDQYFDGLEFTENEGSYSKDEIHNRSQHSFRKQGYKDLEDLYRRDEDIQSPRSMSFNHRNKSPPKYREGNYHNSSEQRHAHDSHSKDRSPRSSCKRYEHHRESGETGHGEGQQNNLKDKCQSPRHRHCKHRHHEDTHRHHNEKRHHKQPIDYSENVNEEQVSDDRQENDGYYYGDKEHKLRYFGNGQRTEYQKHEHQHENQLSIVNRHEHQKSKTKHDACNKERYDQQYDQKYKVTPENEYYDQRHSRGRRRNNISEFDNREKQSQHTGINFDNNTDHRGVHSLRKQYPEEGKKDFTYLKVHGTTKERREKQAVDQNTKVQQYMSPDRDPHTERRHRHMTKDGFNMVSGSTPQDVRHGSYDSHDGEMKTHTRHDSEMKTHTRHDSEMKTHTRHDSEMKTHTRHDSERKTHTRHDSEMKTHTRQGTDNKHKIHSKAKFATTEHGKTKQAHLSEDRYKKQAHLSEDRYKKQAHLSEDKYDNSRHFDYDYEKRHFDNQSDDDDTSSSEEDFVVFNNENSDNMYIFKSPRKGVDNQDHIRLNQHSKIPRENVMREPAMSKVHSVRPVNPRNKWDQKYLEETDGVQNRQERSDGSMRKECLKSRSYRSCVSKILTPKSDRHMVNQVENKGYKSPVDHDFHSEVFSPSVSMAKLKLSTPTSGGNGKQHDPRSGYTTPADKTVLRRTGTKSVMTPQSYRKDVMKGHVKGNDLSPTDRPRRSLNQNLFPVSDKVDSIKAGEERSNTKSEIRFQVESLSSNKSGQKRITDTKTGGIESYMNDCVRDSVGFISLDKLSKYTKHFTIEQGQFRESGTKRHQSAISENVIKDAIVSSSDSDDGNMNNNVNRLYKDYYHKVVDKAGERDAEKENVRRSQGHSNSRRGRQVMTDSEDPKMRKSLFESNKIHFKNSESMAKSVTRKMEFKANNVASSNSQDLMVLNSKSNTRLNRQGNFNGTNFQVHQSTPIKKGVLLQMNETMSTILGSEDIEKDEEDEIVLL